MQINDQGTFYVEGEYKAGDIILTAGDWELVADVDGYKKYAFGYEPDDFPELVTNGTFDDPDVSDWVALNGSVSFVSGELEVNTSNIGGASLAFSTEIGKKYSVSADMRVSTASAVGLRITTLVNNNATSILSVDTTSSTMNTLKGEFVASSETMYFYARNATAGISYADNVSVKLVHPKAGDTIQLGNGHHKDFRYYPYKLSATDITELTR